jgi:hypothetical protein
MGKYVLRVGHRWSLHWTYWAQLPYFWWRIRGWFGLSRATMVMAIAGVTLLVALLAAVLRRKPRP